MINALFEIIIFVITEPTAFSWTIESAGNAAAVYPNNTKILLANGLSIFYIKAKLIFNDRLRSLLRNAANCITLDSRALDNLILADNLFAKVLRIFENWLSNNL